MGETGTSSFCNRPSSHLLNKERQAETMLCGCNAVWGLGLLCMWGLSVKVFVWGRNYVCHWWPGVCGSELRVRWVPTWT